jgi:TonB family protein
MTLTHFLSRCSLLLPCALWLALTPAAQAADQGVTASLDSQSCAKPAYPKEALRKEQEGTVTLRFIIKPDGTVSSANILSTSFHPLLDQAALNALKLCRFKPGQVNGTPLMSSVDTQYVWTLEGSKGPGALPHAPAHLKPFLAQARAADAITDPYQRCLAFPDLPGNNWPVGMGKTYCDITAGKRITANTIGGMLAMKNMAELDAMFRRDLERHFSADRFSEVIHLDFNPFDNAGNEANLLSQDWLEQAPESAFANLARGMHLLASARAARGGKWASETPRENLRRMDDFAVMAARHFDKALKLEPRLMPAYVAQINAASLNSMEELGESSFERANAVDPACRYVGKARMGALEPRWGGSYAQMRAYAKTLEPHLARRPLLSLVLVLPAIDQAKVAASAKENARVVALLEPASKIAPHIDLLTQLGTAMPHVHADEWETLARLLTAYRYDDDDYPAAFTRGRLISDLVGDPAWALPSMRHAAALRPDDPQAKYELGRVHQRLSNFSEAEALMTSAMATPRWHREALFELIRIAGEQADWAKTAQYGAQFTGQYPDVARGWFLYGYARRQQGAQAEANAMFANFVRLAQQQKFDASDEQLKLAKRYLAGKGDPVPTGRSKKV